MNALAMIERCAARQGDTDPTLFFVETPQSRELDATMTRDAEWIAARPQQSLPESPVTPMSQVLEVPR